MRSSLYRLARPEDLVAACRERCRGTVVALADRLAERLSTRSRAASIVDGLTAAACRAPDTVAVRVWAWQCGRLLESGIDAGLAPPAGLVRHLLLDSTEMWRLEALMAWQLIGAAAEGDEPFEFWTHVSPGDTLTLGARGLLVIGEQAPFGDDWEFRHSQASTVVRRGSQEWSREGNGWKPGIQEARSPGIHVPVHDQSLFAEVGAEFPVIRGRSVTSAWIDDVSEAVSIVGGYSTDAAEVVNRLVRAAAPLLCGAAAIGSASPAETIGMVFLPCGSTRDQLVECLLHEAMHQLLYRIEECVPLFEPTSPREELYYSPWRSEPRPLRMTLHGSFVFAAVADLYLWQGASSELGVDPITCHRRAFERSSQSRVALDVVRRHAHLATIGERVMDEIERCLDDVDDRIEVASEARVEVIEGLEAHQRSHASYVR